MKPALTLRIALVIAAVILPACKRHLTTPARPLNGNGIYVGDPKVYDDASLEALLRAAQAKVNGLSGFDQTSITKNIGTVQGASAEQTQVAAQVTGLPVQGATKTAVTPNAPSQPNLPSFSLPSTFSPSAGDIFNEQTQLNFQMTNLQLLLEGALSDQFVDGTTIPKRRATIGFPITIQTPLGFEYRHAIAQVDVEICSPPRSLAGNPSLVNIIPRERTYNVASIVSKTASLGGGAVAGVVNFGGGLVRGHQTFYLVQDQDTLAIPLPPAANVCQAQRINAKTRQPENLRSDAVSFEWQFRPVLGQEVVRDGTRQTFAQVAMPPALEPLGCSATVTVRSLWRQYDAKSGRVGNLINGTAGVPRTFQVGNFDLQPKPRTVLSEDNGDGTVTVRAMGGYKAGTRVRIGSLILDSTSALFEQNPNYIKFTASAALLATVGAVLVNRDGTEAAVVNAPAGAPLEPCPAIAEIPRSAPTPPPPGAVNAPTVGPRPAPPPPPPDAVLNPLTDTTSILTLSLSAAEQPDLGEQGLVLIGTQVFGLRNAPFLERDASHVKLIVTNDLLRTNRTAKWVRLFGPNPPRIYSIPAPGGTPAPADPAVFAISGVTLVASGVPGPAVGGAASKTGNYYAITGSKLDTLVILTPTGVSFGSLNTATIKEFFLPDDVAKEYKNIVVRHNSDAPVVLALPAAQAAAAGGPAKPSIDAQPAAGIPATSKTLALTGSGMTQVIAVLYNATPLPFTAGSDKALTISQLPALSAPGITLVFLYADKSLQPYFVPVAAAPAGH